MPFPAHIGTGLIVGAFESWVLDGPDPDALPDRKPMVGLQITITPSVTGGLIRNETDGTLVTIEPLKVTTNADGVLGYWEMEGDEGSWHTGVRAVSPQDDQLDPSGWTYRVEIRSAANVRLSDFSITFPPDAVFDLAREAPVPANPGTAVAEWVRVRGEVMAEVATVPALVEAAAAAGVDPRVAEAEAARDQAEVFAATTVELQDEAIAQAISTTGSETRTQLNATIGEQATPLIQAVRSLSNAVLLGDSRTQYNGNYLQSQASSTAVTHDDRGYVSCAMVLLRQRLDILKNGGVGGDTVAQMLARTDALLALGPGWLIGFGCINSVNQGVSAASIIADLTAIFDKCAALGVRVVWGTDWISAGTDTAGKKQAAATVNEWLRREASRRREFYLADYAAVMSDPATGLPVAAYASDGLHQDGPGGFIMAQELVKVLEPLLPPMDRLTVSNEDTTNVLINGMLEGDGGTGRATSWHWPGSGPVVFSKVARTDGYQGDWQQVVVTGAVPIQSPIYQQVAAAAARWAEGDRVFFECEFETDSADWSASEFSARLSLLGVSGTAPQFVADDMSHAGVPGQSYRPERGIFRTPVLRIHEGTTHIQAGIRFVGTGTFRIARARVVKVT